MSPCMPSKVVKLAVQYYPEQSRKEWREYHKTLKSLTELSDNSSACRLWPVIPPNPFIATATPLPRRITCSFACQLRSARLSYLWEHAVQGQPLLPAAAMLEFAAAAGRYLTGGILFSQKSTTVIHCPVETGYKNRRSFSCMLVCRLFCCAFPPLTTGISRHWSASLIKPWPFELPHPSACRYAP